MKVIFLDIDGVLNDNTSNSNCDGYIGIDDSKVKILKSIIDATDAAVVLSSTWKKGWYSNLDSKTEQNALAAYLDKKLAKRRIYILDKTPGDPTCHRGKEITNWLKNKRVESYIVLDDEIFEDFEENNIMPHLVKTDFYNGGLCEHHVEKAVELLGAKKITKGGLL